MRCNAIAVFGIIVFAAKVTCWTIDLPEVRRFYFEKHNNDNADGISEVKKNNQTFYDNTNGNSLHNEDEKYYDVIRQYGEIKSSTYADGYKNYESYMVRKVQTALDKGSAYLDGLRVSIERYIVVLQNCSRINSTLEQPSNLTAANISVSVEECQQATAFSEYVRRLAELALWTTRRLQDVSYTAKYSKDDSMEENELVLRLAWYLEKLAQLTGYDPEVDRVTTTENPPVPTVPQKSGVNLTKEMMAAILDCLRQNRNSSEHAIDRCALPNTASVTEQLANLYGLNAASSPNPPLDASGRVSRASIDATPGSALEPELLVATDNKSLFPRILTAVKSRNKRSAPADEHPIVNFIKYYGKHKLWIASNSKIVDTENKSDFDVRNELENRSVSKRSIKEKDTKVKIDTKNKFVLVRPATYDKKQPALRHNIKEVLEKIHTTKVLAVKKLEHLRKVYRIKRSMRLQVPVGPQGDKLLREK